jgi:hypothetical protein
MPSTPKQAEDRVTVSVELATSPHPSISFAFSLPDGWKVGSVEVQVGVNGSIGIGEEDGLGCEGEEKEKVARALERCGGDVGVWVEWLRGRMG